ncbi:MAG: acetolactate synthase small subunit [Opitutales bacterium]
MKHTISALVENKFGVLARVAGMFSGRGFNIETLNVGPMPCGKYSRITVTLSGTEDTIKQCIGQLSKLINVIEVKDFSELGSFVSRELVIARVQCTKETRGQLIEIADLFRSKVIDVYNDSLVIECTGNPTKIAAFLSMIESYGIIEMARTGNVSLERGINLAKK